jgi:hypothetical protein
VSLEYVQKRYQTGSARNSLSVFSVYSSTTFGHPSSHPDFVVMFSDVVKNTKPLVGAPTVVPGPVGSGCLMIQGVTRGQTGLVHAGELFSTTVAPVSTSIFWGTLLEKRVILHGCSQARGELLFVAPKKCSECNQELSNTGKCKYCANYFKQYYPCPYGVDVDRAEVKRDAWKHRFWTLLDHDDCVFVCECNLEFDKEAFFLEKKHAHMGRWQDRYLDSFECPHIHQVQVELTYSYKKQKQ